MCYNESIILTAQYKICLAGVSPMRTLYLLKTYLNWLIILARYLFALLLAPAVKRTKFYKNLWIISERGTDARDNAFHLFSYIRRHAPGISIAYIIKKDSADFDKVSSQGAVILFGSFRHYLALACAEMKISTHIMGFTPDMYFFTKLSHFGLVRGPIAFIQHGIIRNDLPLLHQDVTSPDLFVTSLPRERDFICKTFGQPEKAVQVLGLCRYDALVPRSPDKAAKTILFMPTWRMDLQHAGQDAFLNSAYFHACQSLLNSPLLGRILNDSNCTFLFYPHYEVQKFIDLFSSKSSRVRILSFQADVQQLLLEADILITDYSSISFDMAYMEKPMVFYQFDGGHFWSTHYRKGYFDDETDGFGPVALTEDALLRELSNILSNGGQMAPEFLDRARRFFAYRDQDNCKRNFEAILKLAEGAK